MDQAAVNFSFTKRVEGTIASLLTMVIVLSATKKQRQKYGESYSIQKKRITSQKHPCAINVTLLVNYLSLFLPILVKLSSRFYVWLAAIICRVTNESLLVLCAATADGRINNCSSQKNLP